MGNGVVTPSLPVLCFRSGSCLCPSLSVGRISPANEHHPKHHSIIKVDLQENSQDKAEEEEKMIPQPIDFSVYFTFPVCNSPLPAWHSGVRADCTISNVLARFPWHDPKSFPCYYMQFRNALLKATSSLKQPLTVVHLRCFPFFTVLHNSSKSSTGEGGLRSVG